jgi:hypothetical protein
MDWTNEADAMLRKLWEAGGTLTTVARDMARAGYTFSRNAISGRKWRLGKDQPFVRSKSAPMPRRSSPRPRQRSKRMSITEGEVKLKVVPREEPADGVNYLDNTEDGCKAILDKIGTDGLRMCCGVSRVKENGVTVSAYCLSHHTTFNNLPTGARIKQYG